MRLDSGHCMICLKTSSTINSIYFPLGGFTYAGSRMVRLHRRDMLISWAIIDTSTDAFKPAETIPIICHRFTSTCYSMELKCTRGSFMAMIYLNVMIKSFTRQVPLKCTMSPEMGPFDYTNPHIYAYPGPIPTSQMNWTILINVLSAWFSLFEICDIITECVIKPHYIVFHLNCLVW